MIEQPDGTLCPCADADLKEIEGRVMDGLFSAFDTQDPLSGFTQVADAGNVMSDGEDGTDNHVFEESEGTKTFLDKPYGTRIKLRKPDMPYQSLALAMADAADQIRERARNYYTNYDELPADVTLPEAGVEVFQLGPEQYTFDEAIIGSITIKKTAYITNELGHTPFPVPEPKGLIARLHFHWTDTRPSPKDRITFRIVSQNVGPAYEAWIASYTEEERAIPFAHNRIELGDEPENAVLHFHTHPNNTRFDTIGPSDSDQSHLPKKYYADGVVRSHKGYHIIRSTKR